MSLRLSKRSLWILGVLAVAQVSVAAPADTGVSVLDAPVATASQSRRIVAVGDIHGAFDELTSILQETGLIDEELRWSGGDAIFVQTGDFTDRGPNVRRCMDLLMRLQQEAPDAGGEAIVLLANHEVMNLVSAVRDVAPVEYAAFVDDDSARRQDEAFEGWAEIRAERARAAGDPEPPLGDDVRAAWEVQYPLGYSERMDAFGPQGTYGRWLRELPTAARIGDILFMHAGVSPALADRTVDQINEQVWTETGLFDDVKAEMVNRDLITPNAKIEEIVAIARTELGRILAASDRASGAASNDREARFAESLQLVANVSRWQLLDENGFLWFRGWAMWTDADQDVVAEVLGRQGVSHIVVAHTTQLDGTIKARFTGGVFLIDTGMLTAHYGGRPSALEIVDGRFTAIYVGERVELFRQGALPTSRRRTLVLKTNVAQNAAVTKAQRQAPAKSR